MVQIEDSLERVVGQATWEPTHEPSVKNRWSSMNKLSLSLMTVLLVATFASAGHCIGNLPTEETAVNVSVTTNPICALSAENPSMTLDILYAFPGEQPVPVSSRFTYNITNNESGKRLVGQLQTAAPEGLLLKAHSAVPEGSGGTDCGWVTLSTTPTNMVTNLGPVAAKDVPVDVELTGSVTAGVQSTTMVFTMTMVSSQ